MINRSIELEATLRLALEGAANYIDVLGGDGKKYRQLLAQQSAERDNPKDLLSNEQVEPVAKAVVNKYKTDEYHRTDIDLTLTEAGKKLLAGEHSLYTHPPVPTAQPKLQTCNCRWDGEVQVQQCTLHEAHVDAIHEWAERAKTAEAKLKEQPKEPEQEPVAWMQDTTCGLYVIDHPDEWHCIPLYTTPPQRKPLTDEEIEIIDRAICGDREFCRAFVRAIEAEHGITASEAEDSARSNT